MSFIKLNLGIFFFLFLHSFGYAQNLVKSECEEERNSNDVLALYKYQAEDHFMEIKLYLNRDSTFYFNLASFNRNLFSEGKWNMVDSILTLKSTLTSQNIPVELVYSTDSLSNLNKLKVSTVRNLKGEEMADGLVAINSSAVKCIPSYGICNNEFNSIDSIQVFFENGASSKWMRITKNQYSQIRPVVQINFLISNYIFFENRKYQILQSSLKPLSK